MRKTVSKKPVKKKKKYKQSIKPAPLPPDVPHPNGRPTIYSIEITSEICRRMICGESLRSICRDDKMPNIDTVYAWLSKYKEFSEQYDRARADQVDTFADEIIEISDDGTNDFVERETKSGHVMIVADHEHIQRSRLRVDARKWVAERMKPKKYGQNSEGVKVSVNVNTQTSIDFSKMNAEEITDILLGRKNGRDFIPRETSQARADTA